MSAADRERHRLERLDDLLVENHVTREAAQREERVGPMHARAEEYARRPCWKIQKSQREGE